MIAVKIPLWYLNNCSAPLRLSWIWNSNKKMAFHVTLVPVPGLASEDTLSTRYVSSEVRRIPNKGCVPDAVPHSYRLQSSGERAESKKMVPSIYLFTFIGGRKIKKSLANAFRMFIWRQISWNNLWEGWAAGDNTRITRWSYAIDRYLSHITT